MVTAPTSDMRALFDRLVSPEVIEAYDRLLATDGCAKADADAVTGGPEIVRALTSLGMAHIMPHTPADPAWLRPASPDLALQGVLAGHQNRLAQDTERLLAGHRRLAEAQARYGIAMNGKLPEHMVEIISDRTQISELSASLVNAARQDWMTLEDLAIEMPLTEDFAAPPLPAAAGMVRCRSIYDAAAMDDPVARRIISTCVEAGEQARLLPRVPMKMKLADHTTAMLPLTRTGTAAALVIRAPVIVDALREYFELLWERATPVNAPGCTAAGQDQLPPAQRRVLELMAEGLPDAAIARRAGISITTVRRHITAIMQRLGVPAGSPPGQRRNAEAGSGSNFASWPAFSAIILGTSIAVAHRHAQQPQLALAADYGSSRTLRQLRSATGCPWTLHTVGSDSIWRTRWCSDESRTAFQNG